MLKGKYPKLIPEHRDPADGCISRQLAAYLGVWHRTKYGSKIQQSPNFDYEWFEKYFGKLSPLTKEDIFDGFLFWRTTPEGREMTGYAGD